MPASNTATSKCPISTVSYDVLREIFLHCIPHAVERYKIPNTRIVLMRLCQVCATWRMVALTFPLLWRRQHLSLTIADSDSFPLEMPATKYAFFLWWRKNLGRLPPFLVLENHPPSSKLSAREKHKLNLHEMISLLDYITSAQELTLDEIFWRRIQQAIDIGYIVNFPNLCTLSYNQVSEVFYVHCSIPEDSTPLLRHLILEADLPYAFSVPPNWCTLTHILVSPWICIPLNSWFSLIRGLPELQWADIAMQIADYESDLIPAMYTHSRLLVLSISIWPLNENNIQDEFSYGRLFFNLQLPVLNVLEVCATDYEAWTDERGMADISNVLKSTPAITRLLLGHHFLSPNSNVDTMIKIIQNATESIWTQASQLAHLQMTMDIKPDKRVLDGFLTAHLLIQSAFTRSKWLDLKNPSCPLRIINLCIDNDCMAKQCTEIRISEFPDVLFELATSFCDEFADANSTIARIAYEGDQLYNYSYI
ncbi:hypothetical protein BDN70DRAFT_981521 [Pholiota conissans]|uniref:F-box domain-containing protein n=1 Tax=Pholiota conissans TaxID=109636 RepID=A0A9P6D1T2_9AGAR|nr:hypothetical protein BDN70DRAFT_981521 [Pholiota conissans]